ncbi:hypothetical protein AB0E62_00515 [Streptomyces sp. NPDC038707]|uniref:hypothetical protein n=1 Tax=Streptomyces sp. NPDC038707 TaxID=3154329 RepID=UPI0033D604D1
MQDGDAIRARADEAGAELRKLLRDKPEAKIDITLVPARPNPAVYREILEILFGPEDVTRTP